jgi:hypothetical protein
MSSSLAQREGVVAGATEGADAAGATAGATEGATEGAGAAFAINRGTYLFDMDTILSVVSLFKFITKSFVNFF